MYAPEALEDLKKIKANIIENFEDEEVAVRSLRKLMDMIDVPDFLSLYGKGSQETIRYQQ